MEWTAKSYEIGRKSKYLLKYATKVGGPLAVNIVHVNMYVEISFISCRSLIEFKNICFLMLL